LQLLDTLGTATVSASVLDALVSGVRISASLVVSEAGEFSGEEGSSKTLSINADKLWLSALRRNSQIVLTSGKTFRIEQYRMPRTANLAVLTRSELDLSGLTPGPEQRIHLLQSSNSFESSVADVQGLGYERVHIEFGPTGIAALLRSELAFTLFLSGPSTQSVERAAERLGAKVTQLGVVDGLQLAKAR
jgi:hypothetical protein